MIRRLALVLVLVTPVSAQLTAKQAVAQFKSAAKAELKLFKQLVKDAHEDFVDAVAQDLLDYTSGALGWESTVLGAFSSLLGLQSGMQEDLDASMLVVANAGTAALVEFAQDGEAFPPELYFGAGGALDDVIAAFHAVVDKELAAARKALKKTIKTLAADDVVMLVSLQRPDQNDHYVVETDTPFTFGGELLSVHTVVTGSDRNVTGDGVINIAGRGYTDTVNLSFGGAASFTDTAEISPSSRTWVWQSGLDSVEGNYVVSAAIEADTTALILNLGVP